jgi:hypothetical protein
MHTMRRMPPRSVRFGIRGRSNIGCDSSHRPCIVIGLVLLVRPGIFLALMFMFAMFIVIDREFGPIER